MNKSLFNTVIAILLVFSLIAPSAVLIAPARAYAQEGAAYAVPTAGSGLNDIIVKIKSVLTAANTYTTSVATYAQYVNTYVLQPLAFVVSGEILKAITAGVIAFVIGKANGTGIPQFVVDVQRTMQTVSDEHGEAFFRSLGKTNSPYAGSIGQALREEYLNKTSLAGFWAENMDTIARNSPREGSFEPFLEGRRSTVPEWMGITTQVKNNPYLLYPKIRTGLSATIGPGVAGATGARIEELAWGDGIMSWCGDDFGEKYTVPADASEPEVGESGAAKPADGTESKQEGVKPTGINPGDPCIDSKGNVRTIKTPATVITNSLNKVLGGKQDQIVAMGDVGPEINSILNNISTVMKTINLATQILGGPGSGGLFGVDTPSGSDSSTRFMQYQAPGNLGVTGASVYRGAAELPMFGSDMLERVEGYEAAWNTLRIAANTASSSIASLVSYCAAEQELAPEILKDNDPQDLPNFLAASSAQIAAATSSLALFVAPVLAAAAAASSTAAAARAEVERVQTKLEESTLENGADALDTNTLFTMPPTASDLAEVEHEASVLNLAVASPRGSLSVSGISTLDRMNLLTQNATTLKTVCTPVPRPASGKEEKGANATR